RVTFPFALWAHESVIAQITEPHKFAIASTVRQQFLSWRFFHHFRTDGDAPSRHPQVAVRTPMLSHDGSDLAAAFRTIIEIGDDAGLKSAIDEAFPGARLDVEANDIRMSVLLHMPGFQRPFRATELSDGMLRYLCLVAALMTPRPPPLIALNEPETSIHPDLL